LVTTANEQSSNASAMMDQIMAVAQMVR
jgi:hypothetical protein